MDTQAESRLGELYGGCVSDVDWLTATTAEEALELLAGEEVDLVLLDLWIGHRMGDASQTVYQFDHVPASARGLSRGQELLRKVRDRLPSMPVYAEPVEGMETTIPPSEDVLVETEILSEVPAVEEATEEV